MSSVYLRSLHYLFIKSERVPAMRGIETKFSITMTQTIFALKSAHLISHLDSSESQQISSF